VKRVKDDERRFAITTGESGKQVIGMFNVLAPGKLVLTLRSTPPFVAESAFALALTILLAAPLIVRVYLLLVRAPDKLSCPSPYEIVGRENVTRISLIGIRTA